MKSKAICYISVLLFVLIIYSCQSDASIEFKRYYSAGNLVYQSHCKNCHGAKGEGLGALIPPLTDSIYLKNNKATLACGIKNGLKKTLNISGKVYDGQMPSSDLTPIEIAQVITYVTNSFGSNQGIISNDQIENDLTKCNN